MTTPYAAHLRIGSHVWDVTTDDDPDYGPLAGLRHSWYARPDDGWPTQHDPTPLVFGVIVEAGTDFDDVDQGTTVHFTFTPDGYASPLVEFGGTVRDLTGYPHPRGMVYEITALDHLVALKEDYVTGGVVTDALVPPGTLWDHLLQPVAGSVGTGRRSDFASLPDPWGGQASRPATNPPTGATWAAPWNIYGSTWDVLTAILAVFLERRDAATGALYTPRYQRGVLTYQLDGSGDLLASRPFLGTWTYAGPLNAPLELALVDGVWTAAGGNVDGSLLATSGTRWARERLEPNVAILVDPVLGEFPPVTRPHTGPDVVRRMPSGMPPTFGESGDATWVVAGVENPDQWGTRFTLMAARDPGLVAGWFTLPTAMQTFIAVHDVDPRHTPTGSGTQAGMLSGASLVIPAGGDWRVDFTLRRTLPDADAFGTGGWTPAEAITIDQMATDHPTVTFANIDPTLTIDDALLIGE